MNILHQVEGAIGNALVPTGLITLAGTLTLTLATYNTSILNLDPGGAARTVVLYPEADAKGLLLLIANWGEAAEVLTVNDDASALVAYVQPGESVVVACDGTSWAKVAVAGGEVPVAVTASGTVALTAASRRLQQIDPGGAARDVTLPAISAMKAGDGFLIDNAADAAETITVKDADANTVASIPQNRAARIVSTGAAWVAFPYSRNGS